MQEDGIYVQMFSIHGLIRAEHMELGRDADTGGQVKYVIELGRHLARMPGVRGVDLFTRWVSDKAVSTDYARVIEPVEDKFRIIRIRCGGTKYIRKELLWPHVDEYIDKTIRFIKQNNALPDIVHGHYADAGYVAMHLARIFGVPFVFTGHSLGRPKRQKLLEDGMSEAEIEKKIKLSRRIAAEEEVLAEADLVVTSTQQEIRDQYGMYAHPNPAVFRSIPPGLDIDRFYPFYRDRIPQNQRTEEDRYAQASILHELDRFFMHPDRPVILALCRPDKRKNIAGLVKAYGEDRELQAMANLAVFAGIRKDITQMEDNERNVLTDMLLLLDKYDLYGMMAIPKKHDFEHEVPELYRIAAAKRGVFVNPALTEPFGITLIEASATGIPVVATHDGGPREIVDHCKNGILVDPQDPAAIAAALKTILSQNDKWETFSKNGIMNVRKHYTWATHAQTYLNEVQTLRASSEASDMNSAVPSDAIGRRIARLEHFIVTDIDNTLIDDENEALAELIECIHAHRDRIGFAVATGRPIDSAVAVLAQHGVPAPDIIISSVGSEIYYGKEHHYGQGWDTHISDRWDRERIVSLLADMDFLEYQDEKTQRRFKVSYDMAPAKDRLAVIHDRLLKHRCRYNLIYSHECYLDILPYRASKGKAIRYLSYKWDIPLRNFLVCGDSGNDEEMLRGEPSAVVVGNYSPELETLRGAKRVYFAARPGAGGILEALAHYRFLENAKAKTS